MRPTTKTPQPASGDSPGPTESPTPPSSMAANTQPSHPPPHRRPNASPNKVASPSSSTPKAWRRQVRPNPQKRPSPSCDASAVSDSPPSSSTISQKQTYET